MAGHEVRFFSHCDFEVLVRSMAYLFILLAANQPCSLADRRARPCAIACGRIQMNIAAVRQLSVALHGADA